MYGTSYLDNIKISSYEGTKELPDTKIVADISYGDKFNDNQLSNWEKIEGNSSVAEGGHLYLTVLLP